MAGSHGRSGPITETGGDEHERGVNDKGLPGEHLIKVTVGRPGTGEAEMAGGIRGCRGEEEPR